MKYMIISVETRKSCFKSHEIDIFIITEFRLFVEQKGAYYGYKTYKTYSTYGKINVE